jgi:hypothetical protein
VIAVLSCSEPLVVVVGQMVGLWTISTGAAWTLLTATNAPQVPGVASRAVAEPAARLGVDLVWRAGGDNPLTGTFVELALQARDRGELGPAPAA